MNALTLLEALDAGRPLSGAALARRLGISRTAVWKQVERLRALGADIDAVPGRGYRLTRAFERLDARRIGAALEAAVRPLLRLDVVAEIDSTSAELGRRALRGAPSGLALLAEHQNAGRGRRGRRWQSPIGANLYLSLLWRFERGIASLSGLSLAVAVALAEAVRALGVREAMIKWPNDIVLDDAKLAGVLVDVGGEWGGPCHAVIGIGLNVAMPARAAAAIDQRWTDLVAALGTAPSRNEAAARVLSRVAGALVQHAREGLAPFLALWPRYDALLGREIELIDGAAPQRATALGVDAEGRLRVRLAAGVERALASAELSVRGAAR